jgi:hypothetical protein
MVPALPNLCTASCAPLDTLEDAALQRALDDASGNGGAA